MRLLCARSIVGILAIVLGGGAMAHATPIVTVGGSGDLASAQTAESSFLSGLPYFVTEDFESPAFSAGDREPSFNTTVGTFTAVTPGNTGIGAACEGQCLAGLAILNGATTPFEGRFAVGGSQWLDSNDYKKMTWVAGGDYYAVGFFITDPNDVGARLAIDSYDADMVMSHLDLGGTPLAGGLPNGQVYYVTIVDDSGISQLDFYSDAGHCANDGYGIDRFTAAPVPEPGTLLLLGAGLMGLAARRRSRRS